MSDAHAGGCLVEALRPALSFVETRRAKTTAQQIAICEIPAPTFHEEHRARFVGKLLRPMSLSSISTDGVGNLVAVRRGAEGRRCIVVAAHLDTVFGSGVAPQVVQSGRRGQVLKAPGIADNAGGLATMLAVADALDHARIRTRHDVLFVGSVCEEALGNLRGVRHLLRQASFRRRVAGFIALDGANPKKLVTSGPAIRRYRVTFRARGGHSWGRFGTPSPIHCAGRLIARLASMRVPDRPRTTFNVGIVSDGDEPAGRAGVIVTAVPASAAIEVDLRSETARSLDRLDRAFRSAIERALKEERHFATRDAESLRARVECIGDRPAGRTRRNAPIVRAALESYAQFGLPLDCICASTDATFPMVAGIPAVTIPQGGRGHNTHTLDERIDLTGRERAIKAALLLVVRLAGLA
ncbi:MAG: M20/M25/M40 family metallo-hydrolase [Verrucomicrobia bacterium]|nr:M20/M25/M40 family metallo-hydrolase [Verrucomicrobiota bacterium]